MNRSERRVAPDLDAMRTLVLNGVGFDRLQIVRCQEINVTSSSGSLPWDVAHMHELMAPGGIDAGKHTSRIGDRDHAIESLEMVKAQRMDGKAVVYPPRHSDEILAVSFWSAQDERTYLLPVASNPSA